MNGLMGEGIVVRQSSDSVEIDVQLETKPPQALPITLILLMTLKAYRPHWASNPSTRGPYMTQENNPHQLVKGIALIRNSENLLKS